MNLHNQKTGHNRPMPSLVIVHGLKESGKSTLADYYCKEYGYKRLKMAGPLKNMIRSLLKDGGVDPSLIEEYVEGNLKEVPIPQMSGRTSRHLMQTIGDEWRRMQSEDFWIEIALGKLKQHFSSDEKVIIDDIRYHNEFGRLSVYDPLSFAITRGTKHFEPIEKGRHLGEIPMAVEGFDFHIANDYQDKDSLWREADSYFDKWARLL